MSFNSTTNGSDGGEEPYQHDVLCPICKNIMDAFVMPVAFILGILGNILAIVVVLLTKLRRHPPSTYLIALAVSDTLFLVDQILLLHRACNLAGMCQLCIFLQYLAPFCSGWLLVGFTFERFIVVVYPIRQLQWGSWRATRLFIAALVACGVCLSAPTLYMASMREHPESGVATCSNRNSTLANSMNEPLLYTEAALSFFVPFVAISVLNFFIIRAVRRSVRLQATREATALRSHHCSSSTALAGPNGIGGSNSSSPGMGKAMTTAIVRSQRTKREQTSAAITRILILVSIMFVVTSFPTYILRIYIHQMGAYSYSPQLLLALQVTEYPYQLNFTLNFLLYSFSSGTFRGALCKLCCRCWGAAVPAPLRSTETQTHVAGPSPRPSAAHMELQRMGGVRHSSSLGGVRAAGGRGESRLLSPSG